MSRLDNSVESEHIGWGITLEDVFCVITFVLYAVMMIKMTVEAFRYAHAKY